VAEKVGDIYYDVTVETGRMIDAQREIERRARETASSLESMGGGAKAAERGFRDAGAAAQEASGRFRDAAGRLREANGQFVGTKGAAAGAAGGFGQASSAADVLTARLNQVAVAVKLYAAAMAVVKAAQMADEMRMLSARVEVAAGSVQTGAEAMRALQDISTRTQTSMQGNVEVFARLNQSMIQMGGTQADTLQLTELLGKAIKVSGASAVEAKSAMLQFGQALGSGKLAGDEFKSLMENAPYLMRQLADGIGVPVGALKNLSEKGKLTSDVVVNALSKAASQIDQDFQKFPQTIDAAMTMAGDAAKRAAEKLDDMTGTSAILAGATKGLGTVLDKLAEQFASGTTEADKLGRSTLVKTWAEDTATVLTYVVDAADFVVRGFKQMGTALGGLAAAAGAAATGELTQARNILGMMADDIKNIGNAKFSGAKMREQFQFAKDFVGPQAPAGLGYTPSKLKPPAPEDDKKKAKKKPFDAEKYLAGLSAKAATDEWQKISTIEQEALRQNDEHLKKKDISAAQHEKAKTLILAEGAQARQELMAKETQSFLGEMDKQEQEKKRREQAAMEYGAGLTKAINPVDALRQEYEAKLQLVTQYEQMMAMVGVDATAQAEATKAQIRNEYELQRTALAEQTFRSQNEANAFLIDSLNSLSQTATTSIMGLLQGTMSAQDAMKALASTVLNEAVGALVQIGLQQIKNALLADTLAAADKARAAANGAVYAASVGAQVAGMSALAAQNAFAATAAIPIVGPGLAPAAAAMAAAASAALGAPAVATAPLAGARQYGGPVSADKLYRVNERGAPEMYTSSTGKQYMLPTANGQVTAANKIEGGGSVQWNIVVNNTASGTMASASVDQQSRTVQIAVTEVAQQISNNSGPVWSAMRGSTNIRSAL